MLTWAGMWAERSLRAFWPLFSVLAACAALLMLGVQDMLGLETVWGAGALLSLAVVVLAARGVAKFNVPRRGDALARLDATLAELESLIAQINEDALATRLAGLLDEAAEAASGVSTASTGVPDLVARLEGIAANAERVDLDVLAADLSEFLASTGTLLAQDETRALPRQLNETLAEVTLILAQLRDGGVVENTVATLDSARSAADTFAAAGGDLPGLIAEAQAVLARANTTLEGYSASGGLGRDARTALREVEAAASAVASLARAIERNPNSLIRGR
jgi:paraquat-inducible protein B